eukprot:gene1160-10674_t
MLKRILTNKKLKLKKISYATRVQKKPTTQTVIASEKKFKKFNDKESDDIKNLTIAEVEEKKNEEETKPTIKLEEKVTIEELHESLKFFKDKIEPTGDDMYPIFRNILTYNSWMIPTSSNENNEETMKVDAIVEENGKKSIKIYSSENLWKSEKEGSKLIEIEHLSTICSNEEIEEIIIDHDSEHMFIIPKDFFEIVSQWENIIHTELCLYFIKMISNIAKIFQQSGKEIPDTLKQNLLYEPIQFLKEYSELLIPIRSTGDKQGELMMIEKREMTFIGLFTSPDLALEFCKTAGYNFDETFRSIPTKELFQQIANYKDSINGLYINYGNRNLEKINTEFVLSNYFIDLINKTHGQ